MESTDLISLEASTRYLGHGLGELSLQPGSGFEWVAIGPAKNPDILLFIGNVESPGQPEPRRSNDGGDRRHWKQAFKNARVCVAVTQKGTYRPTSNFPKVEAARLAHAVHDPKGHVEVCPAFDLKTIEKPITAFGTNTMTAAAVDALAALSVRRSGLSYQDVKTIFVELVGTGDPLAIQQVLRSWTECGLVDVLRQARTGRLSIVARRPSLIMVRRGPEVEATVFGLLSGIRHARFVEVIEQCRSEVHHSEVYPQSPLQPSVHRLRGKREAVERIAASSDFGESEWLRWPDLARTPAAFDISQAYRTLAADDPPSSYKVNAVWDWARLTFRRATSHSDETGVSIERRSHPDGTNIHVVRENGQTWCWTNTRNWALLFGYELRGTPPFVLHKNGRIDCSGISPVHLPLPIARLCALVGEGLPGPVFNASKVSGYAYPFSRRLFGLIEGVITPNWLSGTISEN